MLGRQHGTRRENERYGDEPMTKKSLEDFEQKHGGSVIEKLTKQLAAEKAKVEALAGIQHEITVEETDTPHIAFGLIGDVHIGSLYYYSEALEAYYKILSHRGIDKVFIAGDILDGHRIYKGQEFELRDVGFEKQLSRLVTEYPRVDGLTNYFITGNHDNSFKQAAGVPTGKHIANARSDFVFLGEDQAQYQFDTPNGPFSLRLLHPGGGTAYAISYRLQKIIESLEGGTKPNMLAVGHYHKSELLPSYRNVAGLQTGCFQRQTPFMASKASAAHVGGWIVEVIVGKEKHNEIGARFEAFY